MMELYLGGVKQGGKFWESQKPLDFKDDSLTINTYEEVTANLSNGKPCKLLYIIVEQTNNGATAETITVEIELNGTAYTFSESIASGARASAIITLNQTGGDFTGYLKPALIAPMGYTEDPDQTCFMSFASVGRIRVKQTTDVDGTSAQIEVNVRYELLEDTY